MTQARTAGLNVHTGNHTMSFETPASGAGAATAAQVARPPPKRQKHDGLGLSLGMPAGEI